MYPLVSIVTPSFNSGDFLEQAILSVVAQDYPHVEHIIVDGGSTDNTLEVLQHYGPSITWSSEPDGGQADALNKGFRQARGEVIGWLNADDTYQPHAIRSAVKYLQENLSVGLVYGNFNFIDETGKVIYTHCTPPFSPEKLLYGNIIPNAGMFFRQNIIRDIGGINPNLHYVLDWEFVLRIALQYEIYQVPIVWGNFRMTSGTKSVEKPDRFWPEIIPVLREITSVPENELKSHRAPALFWAHLFGSVEFARTHRLEATKNYLAQALNNRMYPVEEAAALAFVIVETATRPWHQGHREHPEAQQTVSRFATCLGDSPVEQALKTHLNLYQSFVQLKHQSRGQDRASLTEILSTIKKEKLLSLPLLRLLLYLILGTPLLLKLRTIKNRFIIMWRRYV